MTAREAAHKYHRLDTEGQIADAIRFAHDFEAKASSEDFDEYLRILDLLYGA